AACGIHDDVIHAASFGGLHRVKQHGRGVAARLGLDDFGAGALAPDLQLLDGGGAESIGGGEQHALALRAQQAGQLADGGGLAGAVHPDHQQNFRRFHLLGRTLGGGEDGEQLLLQQALEFGDVGNLAAVGLFAKFFQDFVGGGGAEIGGDEGGFQIVERGAVNLFAEGDDVVNALAQALAGAGDGALHAVEEAGFLFFLLFLVEGAEESLDHEFIIRGGSPRR